MGSRAALAVSGVSTAQGAGEPVLPMNDDQLLRLCPDGRRLIGVLIQSRPLAEPFVAQALSTGGVPHFLFAEMYQWKVFEKHRNCCVICFDSNGQSQERMPI
jgi:hypothetical protein